MTNTTAIRFKKDADGEWGITGPVDQIKPGATIDVTKRNGQTSTVTVATVADEPGEDGNIFAWIKATARPRTSSHTSPRRGSTARRSASTPHRRRSCRTGGNCSSFGDGRSCGGHDCDGY